MRTRPSGSPIGELTAAQSGIQHEGASPQGAPTRPRGRRRVVRAALIAGVILMVVGGTAYAGIPGTGGVITACYTNQGIAGQHVLTLLDTAQSTRCQAGQTLMQWNQTGPQGPQGPAGPAGPAADVSPLQTQVAALQAQVAALQTQVAALQTQVAPTATPTGTATQAPTLCIGLSPQTCDPVPGDPNNITCRGENYDVNGDVADGCEVADQPLGNHTLATAQSLGSASCDDIASANSFTGLLPSDARVHTNPAVAGFDATTGSAPDYWQIAATGGAFCQDDYSATITTSGGGSAGQCYKLSVITDKGTQGAAVSGSGTATVTQGAGAYSDNSTIAFKIEKTCALPTKEAVTYTVQYHL